MTIKEEMRKRSGMILKEIDEGTPKWKNAPTPKQVASAYDKGSKDIDEEPITKEVDNKAERVKEYEVIEELWFDLQRSIYSGHVVENKLNVYSNIINKQIDKLAIAVKNLTKKGD